MDNSATNTENEIEEIRTGAILPIDFLTENIPVNQYFKLKNMTGSLIPSQGGDSVDIEDIRSKHDFFEVGNMDAATRQKIQDELIEPARKNLDTLIENFTEKILDIQFLNGVCYRDPLRGNFLRYLKNIYNDHLTLLNLKKISDTDQSLLEQSMDICSLATILAIRSDVSSEDVDLICKGALLINIGQTQVTSPGATNHVDKGCQYLKTLGYDPTIINIVRFKSSFEKILPEPRHVIGIVKASYLYQMSRNKYSPGKTDHYSDTHDATMVKLKTYVRLKYLNPRVYHLMLRVFNESNM